MTAIVECFYTTVQSLVAADRSYGFLGLHGKRLAPGEQLTVPGNLIDGLAARAEGPEGNRRHFHGLEKAVAGFTDSHGNYHAPSLAIIKTPAVHLFDPTTHHTKALKVNNGTLGIADPCWGAYTSAGGGEIVFD